MAGIRQWDVTRSDGHLIHPVAAQVADTRLAKGIIHAVVILQHIIDLETQFIRVDGFVSGTVKQGINRPTMLLGDHALRPHAIRVQTR